MDDKMNYTTRGSIGYELHFSDGSTTKIVTRGYGVATIWINGIQHNIISLLSRRGPAIQVVTSLVSEEALLNSSIEIGTECQSDNEVLLQFSPTISKISLFDVSNIDLDPASVPTTIAAVGDGTFKTCGTCGSTSICVSNACTPCNGGWLCDKIKAPW